MKSEEYLKKRRERTAKWKKENPIRERELYRNRYKRNLNFTDKYKSDKSCVLCGYDKHTEILQFHHVKEKSFAISRLCSQASIKHITSEMNKCILICPNCHFWMHKSNKPEDHE